MQKNTIIALVIFGIGALLILAFVPPPPAMVDRAVAPVTTTAVYEGLTPCADCPGIIQRLTLTSSEEGSAEGTFELSLTYLERNVEPFIETGVWTTERGTPTDPDAVVVALYREGAAEPQRLRRLDATSLRFLSMDGTEIDSSLPFTLTLVD